MIIYAINGHDDDGDFELDLYSTYAKAKKVFDELVDERNMLYGEGKDVVKVKDADAEYDCGSHYGTFWIEAVEVK